jgi:hypothetical protein
MDTAEALLSDTGLLMAEYETLVKAANASLDELTGLVDLLQARRRHLRMEQNLGIFVSPEALTYLASRHALVEAALA